MFVALILPATRKRQRHDPSPRVVTGANVSGSRRARDLMSELLPTLKRGAYTRLSRTPLGRTLLIRRLLRKNELVHPFDERFGVRTSGFVQNDLIETSPDRSRVRDFVTHHYVGCSPNCVRRAIESLPDTADYAFYDLGCGMGRALIVASEFRFRSLVGIELSRDLCAIARTNLAETARRYPERTRVTVRNEDAVEARFEQAPLVVFFYHSFGLSVLKPIVERIEALARQGVDIFVIFENPVHADLIERSSVFSRWYGAKVACEPAERPHHFDEDESVVVWRSNPDRADLGRDTGFEIEITKPGWRAEVIC